MQTPIDSPEHDTPEMAVARRQFERAVARYNRTKRWLWLLIPLLIVLILIQAALILLSSCISLMSGALDRIGDRIGGVLDRPLEKAMDAMDDARHDWQRQRDKRGRDAFVEDEDHANT